MLECTPTCCLCQAKARPFSPDKPWLDPKMAVPEGWCSLVAVVPEPVVTEDMQPLADQVDEAMQAGDPRADAAAEFLRRSSPPFETWLLVCPDCQMGPLFEVIARRLHQATMLGGLFDEIPPPPPIAFPGAGQ